MSIRDKFLSTTPRREDLFFPVEQAFNKFFDDFFGSNPVSTVKANAGYPRMNACQSGGLFTITVSVPGMKEEDLEVQIDDRILSVKGQMASEHTAPEGAQYYLRELRQSKFERQLILPDHVTGDPSATMQDGILTLSWKIDPPKQEEKVKKIAINSVKKLEE